MGVKGKGYKQHKEQDEFSILSIFTKKQSDFNRKIGLHVISVGRQNWELTCDVLIIAVLYSSIQAYDFLN